MKKKSLALVIAALLCALLISGCSSGQVAESVDLAVDATEDVAAVEDVEEDAAEDVVEDVVGATVTVSRVPGDVDVEILEDSWVLMINDIFNNFENYYGRTVGIEGTFSITDIGATPYRMVFRSDRSC